MLNKDITNTKYWFNIYFSKRDIFVSC